MNNKVYILVPLMDFENKIRVPLDQSIDRAKEDFMVGAAAKVGEIVVNVKGKKLHPEIKVELENASLLLTNHRIIKGTITIYELQEVGTIEADKEESNGTGIKN